MFNASVLTFPAHLMLVQNREELKAILQRNKFDYVFFTHLHDNNLEEVVKQGDLIRAVLNDVGKGSHMPVAVSLQGVSLEKKEAFKNRLKHELMEVHDGNLQEFEEFVNGLKKKYGISSQ
jgi:hypothetical protein